MDLKRIWVSVKEGFYLEAVGRWWPVLIGGLILGLVFSLITEYVPFPAATKEFPVYQEETGSSVLVVVSLKWKDHVLLSTIGLLVSFGLVWVLEEFRVRKGKEDLK